MNGQTPKHEVLPGVVSRRVVRADVREMPLHEALVAAVSGVTASLEKVQLVTLLVLVLTRLQTSEETDWFFVGRRCQFRREHRRSRRQNES
jgi:hypothetical protein